MLSEINNTFEETNSKLSLEQDLKNVIHHAKKRLNHDIFELQKTFLKKFQKTTYRYTNISIFKK